MVYAIQAEVYFRNTARRDAALANINAKFSSSEMWGNPRAVAITHRDTADPGIRIVGRFANQADQAAAWADLDAAFGTGVNGPVSGSRAWIHDCPHDEPEHGPCVISSERTW